MDQASSVHIDDAVLYILIMMGLLSMTLSFVPNSMMWSRSLLNAVFR